MFDDAKYMAKDAVDRNNALAALDQQRAEERVHGWSKNAATRRGIGALLTLATVIAPLITSLNEPRTFVVYVFVWLAVLALARTAMRAGRSMPIGRTEFIVLAGIGALSAGVALAAQTDVNLQAGVTATAGVIVALLGALPAAPAIVRCWR